jgi:hypothetical protein
MLQIEEKDMPGFFLTERIGVIVITKPFPVTLVDDLFQFLIIIGV